MTCDTLYESLRPADDLEAANIADCGGAERLEAASSPVTATAPARCGCSSYHIDQCLSNSVLRSKEPPQQLTAWWAIARFSIGKAPAVRYILVSLEVYGP